MIDMSKYTATQIKRWDVECEVDNKWVPCRCINHKFDSVVDRIMWAWGVLVGKYDALDWDELPPTK